MVKELVHSEYTGKIVVHNVPPSNMTYSYVYHVYKNTYEWFKGDVRVSEIREEEGGPVYLHSIADEGVCFAITQIGLAQNFVSNKLPPKLEVWTHEKYK